MIGKQLLWSLILSLSVSNCLAADKPAAKADVDRDVLPRSAPDAGVPMLKVQKGNPAQRSATRKPVTSRKSAEAILKNPMETPASSFPIRAKAESEIVVPEKLQTQGFVDSPATVRSELPVAFSPISYTSLQLGLNLRSYTPSGQINIQGLDSYELSSAVGAEPMLSAELRWLPFQSTIAALGFSELYWGGYAQVGYAQHSINLTGQDGSSVDSVQLRTFQPEAGLAADWHLARHERWSLVLKLGLGDLQNSQSGSSSFSSASADQIYASSFIGIQNRFLDHWSGFIGYDRQDAVASPTNSIQLQANNFLIGFLGSFQ